MPTIEKARVNVGAIIALFILLAIIYPFIAAYLKTLPDMIVIFMFVLGALFAYTLITGKNPLQKGRRRK